MKRETELHFENGTDVIKIKRTALLKESAAVLQIWEGVYAAAEAYLDQDLSMHDCIIGLVFAGLDGGIKKNRRMTFGCLIARQLDEGLYERVGAVPCVLDYSGEDDLSRKHNPSGGVFLDETGAILDKVRVSERGRDWPFESVGERRTIVLV
jgi:hypothetical protein